MRFIPTRSENESDQPWSSNRFLRQADPHRVCRFAMQGDGESVFADGLLRKELDYRGAALLKAIPEIGTVSEILKQPLFVIERTPFSLFAR